jgi:sugar O-acyltransferase (sialic acid O-acetyltransferase NeuD family)
MQRKPLLILGTRTLAVEVLDIVYDVEEYEPVGFVENMNRERCGEPLEGLPVHWVDDIVSFASTHSAVCALGTTRRWQFTEQVANLGMTFATIVHPSARVSRKSTIGAGSIVSAGVIVATHTQIGSHVLINRGVLIGHHTSIGDFSSVMPGANIAGACTIGDRTYVGMGAVVIDHLSIGTGAVIGAGSVVTRNVADGTQVVGVPARVVKENLEGK